VMPARAIAPAPAAKKPRRPIVAPVVVMFLCLLHQLVLVILKNPIVSEYVFYSSRIEV
jgi:hypothetical protein